MKNYNTIEEFKNAIKRVLFNKLSDDVCITFHCIEEIVLRCNTVLNTMMAKMEMFRAQKVEDIALITKEHLDSNIKFYERVDFFF